MSANGILRWTPSGFEVRREENPGDGDSTISVADSWRVRDGSVLALELHRDRFLRTAVPVAGSAAAEFWDAAVEALPREGDWFPRVEVRRGDSLELILRLRPAPELGESVVLATHLGDDPRMQPRVKGPSIDALERLRAAARREGIGDIVFTDALGHVVEGAATSIAWWRGAVLCLPREELDRVDSVTERALAAIATATGTRVSRETVTPDELDGLEVWALNALHGPRIVTRWVDGPATAEEPGRLRGWRARLAALRRPLPSVRAESRA